MAHSFVLISSLQEAYFLDLYDRPREACDFRELRLFHRHKDFVENYCLLEELINILLDDIKHLLRTPQRRRRGLSVKSEGDSGYAQHPYSMVPVPNAEEGSPAEYVYNKLHATARNTVERAIGRLKGRFRCLLVHRVLHYKPDMVAEIVIACCVLHNICNRAGLPAPAMAEYDLQEHTALHARGSTAGNLSREVVLAQSSRQDLINRLWRAGNITH